MSIGLINSSALSEAVGSVPDRPQTAFNTAVNGFFNPFSGTPGSNNPAVLAYIAEAFPAEILNLPPRPHQRLEEPEGA